MRQGERGHFEIGHGAIAGCSIFQFSFWQREREKGDREGNFPSRLGYHDKLLRSLSQMMKWVLSLAIPPNKWSETGGSLCRLMLCPPGTNPEVFVTFGNGPTLKDSCRGLQRERCGTMRRPTDFSRSVSKRDKNFRVCSEGARP